jgi:hypothetical protein
MGISFPAKSKAATAIWGPALQQRVPLREFSYRTFLYRTIGSAVILTLFWATVCGGFAQEEKPQIVPEKNKPQESKKPKKGTEPRAVGVLQFSNSGKVTLIPVAILIGGRFYDASAYKADPIPMALESGTIYEAEQAGESQGLFTLNGALHSKGPGSLNPWVGTGTFLPRGTEAAKSTRKAEDVPVGLDNSGDEPPRLTRKVASAPKPSDAKPANGAAGSESPEKPAATSPSAAGKPAEDAKQQAPAPPAASDKAPSATSESPVKAGSGSSSQTPPKSGDDYYRPTLRRGKPMEPAPQDEDNAATKSGGKTAAPAGASAVASLGAGHMVTAISDAGGPEPQSYKFFWKTGEEGERRNQMLALAEAEVRAYVEGRAKGIIAAKPAPKAPAVGRKAPVKQAQPVFENIQFRAFDVWLTNQPVMVFSAEAHIPSGAGAAATEPYSVTLVARTDIYGSLLKLYSGVTDKFHLDVTPRLELIDAVDADGDGRGELLFRETSDAGGGYVIYRATADKLWKMFDSLNAE